MKNGYRYYLAITEDEFKAKLRTASDKLFKKYEDPPEPDFDRMLAHTDWSCATAKLTKDFAKIKFYAENLYTDCSHLNYEIIDPCLLGVNRIKGKGGLWFLGFLAGGDGEHPLYAIVYWDGKALRGYIPEKGNVFNPKAKAVFGDMDSDTSEEDDNDYLARTYGVEIDENFCAVEWAEQNLKFDSNLLQEDIRGRLKKIPDVSDMFKGS